MTQLTQDQALSALEDVFDSEFLKAIAEPVRVKILRLLITGETLDVGAIADQLPQERSVISRHLKTLRDAGLVRVERDGRRRLYTIVPQVFVGRLEAILAATRRCIAVCCPSGLD